MQRMLWDVKVPAPEFFAFLKFDNTTIRMRNTDDELHHNYFRTVLFVYI